MKTMLLSASLIFVGLPATHAQVTVDMSKITCQQFLLMRDLQAVSLWLNGYYQGQKSNPVVETERLKANAKKLRDECLYGKHRETPIMQVIESMRAAR